MAPDDGSPALDAFLAAHEPMEIQCAFAPGEIFGDWRVTAFLGRGGSGEVYRVVHDALGTAAALKVCVRNPGRDEVRDAAVCARFRREAELLAANTHQSFPRFFAFGEREGRPWYVMELLEQRPLPETGGEISRFLLSVASGVQHMHSLGLVHRDIKPANILWRGLCPVLIDLGLAKDTTALRGHAGDSLSIVDGRAVGVGTPHYAAPEQVFGNEISPATDVYALGMLANDCFGGRPPGIWRKVIVRATRPLPQQRYRDAGGLIKAVKRRRRLRAAVLVSAAVVAAGTSALAVRLLCRVPRAQDEDRTPRIQNEEHVPSTQDQERTRRMQDAECAQKEHDEILEMLQKDVY